MVSIPTINVIMLGDSAVGKTQAVRVFTGLSFQDGNILTCGVDYK